MAIRVSKRNPAVRLPDGFGSTRDWAIEFDSTSINRNNVYMERGVFRSGVVRWEVLTPLGAIEHWECHFRHLIEDGDRIDPEYDEAPQLTETSMGAFLI